MNLHQLYKGAKIIEMIENYSLAESTIIDENIRKSSENYFYTEESFWKNIIDNPERYWGKEIELYNFVVSDWIARVPGLYWTESSQMMREHEKSDIAIQSQEWTEFFPPGKSKKVLGGIGTLLLPPTDEGKVLISVSAGCNASTGIPVLLFPEVIEALKIKQGDIINIRKAKWQPMNIQWSKQFASTKDVPRGYLVVDNLEKIEILGGGCPIVYHPFSIMEYEHKDSLLYDFVYVTADSKAKDVKLKIEKFFNDYSKKDGRNGEYLLNPNIINPIFESRYTCPSELQKPSEKAKLNLLYQRIKDVHFNNVAIDLLINDLPKFYQSSNAIITLARHAGINPTLLAEDSATSMSAQLISLCIEKEKVEVLIDRMIYDYPQIFK
jgi:hypothetical protein